MRRCRCPAAVCLPACTLPPPPIAAPPKPLPSHGKSIVFVKFKNNCNTIAQALWEAGFAVDTLHGDMDQHARTRVIGEFRTNKLRVLVATDVAARGLDVKARGGGGGGEAPHAARATLLIQLPSPHAARATLTVRLPSPPTAGRH